MNGWILYKVQENSLSPEAYEIRRFLEDAESSGIGMRVVAPEQLDLIVTLDDRQSVLLDGETVPLPDFLLPRMGSGTTYFALAVIRHLERLGVDTFNSSTSIEAVKDKLYTQQILAQSNLPIAKTMLAKYPVDIDGVERHLGFPVIVKTLSGSQGQGVFLCDTREHLEDLMELIVATQSSVNIILQEFVKTSFGRDLRVLTVGGRAVAAMTRQATDGSFKANVSRGGEGELFPLTPEVDWLATEVARLLNLDIAAIDLLFAGDHYVVCEANSAPGFEGLERWTGISVPKEVYAFVAARLGQLDLVSKILEPTIAEHDHGDGAALSTLGPKAPQA